MDETTQPTFSGGELLAGKYRVERVIGEGGMGIVLAARHEGLNTSVAVKLLRTNALGHIDVVGRFMREARAAVSLRSEHVARVFDVGSLEDGRPYIVMERLEGQDLGDVIEHQSPILVTDAVNYVMQACEAIAEAHAAGIIHRDLKPKNLFLTRAVHGRPLVKVLDFGISKVDPTHAPNEMQLTKTTEVIGSPSYMSPEQLRSARNVDVRTDIWALGVILYELLTGRVPFNAETITELVLVVVTEKEQPVRAFRADVPEGLERIIARCLEKHPDNRFHSVVELVQALEPYADGRETTIADRVRAVAGHSGRPIIPSASSSGALLPAPSPSSRVNVHGGTSVAWGETQSQVGPSPLMSQMPPRTSRAGLIAGLAAGALLFAASGIGGALYIAKRASAHSSTQPPPPIAAGEGSSMPLPPGRKDLPPVPPPPPPATSAPPDPPAATALPDTRKPSGPARGTPAPKPAPSTKPDDLSNIGRR